MPRLIRRYGSRKLYDVTGSRYIGLGEIATLVRRGEEVQVVAARSGEDVTALTLTQVISEEQRSGVSALRSDFLHEVVRLIGAAFTHAASSGEAAPGAMLVGDVNGHAEGTMTKLTRTNGTLLPTLPEPAREVWFAGLGAVSVAEREGGRFFRTLVSEGKKFEKTNLTGVEKGITSMVDTLNTRVEELRAMPSAALDRLGGAMDDSMTAVLHRLGIPTKREINVLTHRVEELTRHLEKPTRTRRATTTKRRRRTKTTA